MQPADNGQGDAVARPKRSIRGSLFGAILVALVAFGVGVAVGNGRISLGSSNDTSLPNSLNYSSINQVYDTLRREYDGKLDENKLLDGMKEGLAEATGDPYTEYFTADQYKKFSEQLNGEGFSGIGAELGLDKDENLIVVAPISGTPAAGAGVKSQDIIAEINGESTSGLSIEEAVTKIRGKKGTKVTLKLIRNRSQTIDLEITRDDIKIPSVESRQLEDGTGYIRVSTFGENTGSLARQQAQELVDKGVKKIILDLRGNPGGVVDSAIDLASLWLPKGTLVMQEKRSNTVVKTYTASGNSILEDVPTVVLIDQGSASASEIVAGALHDNKAARLFGEKSYGKGVVQGIEPLSDGSQLKVTVARWYRPNGQNIDKKGIEPNKKVASSEDDAANGKDAQLEAAQAALRE